MIKHQTIVNFEGDKPSIELLGTHNKGMSLGIATLSDSLKNYKKGYIEKEDSKKLLPGKQLKDFDIIINFETLENIDSLIDILQLIKSRYLKNNNPNISQK